MAATPQRALRTFADALRSADSMATAMSRCPSTFAPQTTEVVRQAQAHGALPSALQALADDFDRVARAQRGVHLMLLWPMTVLAVMTVVVTVLAQFVLPPLRDAYESVGAPLPRATTVLVMLSDAVGAYAWAWALLLCALIVSWQAGRLPRRVTGLFADAFSVMGFVRRYMVWRFAARLVHWLRGFPSSPVMLAAALEHVQVTTTSLRIGRLAGRLAAGLGQGRSTQEVLGAEGLLPRRVSLYVQLGERLNDVAGSLATLAEIVDADEMEAVRGFERGCLISLYVVLAIGVGSIAFAIYGPIFGLGSIN